MSGQMSGALGPHADARVSRSFEVSALNELTAGRWVLLLGPRQHGKTTALLWIKQELVQNGVPCALVDLQRMPPCAAYEQLLEWFAVTVARQCAVSDGTRPSGIYAGDLLSWLEAAIPRGQEPVVILIDEAPSVARDDWRNTFYGQIRAITSERAQAEPHQLPARLRFLFAGTFRPESLVLPLNSPFNVCTRIESDDLTLDQAKELWRRLTKAEPDEFVDRAYDLVGGQPYLLQLLFSNLASVDESDHSTAYQLGVDLLSSGSDGHFDASFGQVVASAPLSSIVRRLTREGSVKYEPANVDFKYLIVLGIARRTQDTLVFRNRLYEQFATSSSQITLDTEAHVTSMSMAVTPPGSYDFMSDGRLREIAESSDRGGVLAYRVGNYRLALTAFGCALEATLLDWLMTVPKADLAKAVTAAKTAPPADRANFDTKFENESNPSSWRLVNLLRVGKWVNSQVRIVDPPHALRQYRNQIHPAEALKAYLPERDLRPEADAAAALLAGVRRDLS